LKRLSSNGSKSLSRKLSEYKTMVAELTHDNRALKNLIEKKL